MDMSLTGLPSAETLAQNKVIVTSKATTAGFTDTGSIAHLNRTESRTARGSFNSWPQRLSVIAVTGGWFDCAACWRRKPKVAERE
jgi:hypothetical protein